MTTVHLLISNYFLFRIKHGQRSVVRLSLSHGAQAHVLSSLFMFSMLISIIIIVISRHMRGKQVQKSALGEFELRFSLSTLRNIETRKTAISLKQPHL